MKHTTVKYKIALAGSAKAKGKRILKVRGIASGAADIDGAIRILRRSRIKRLLLGR